MPALTETYRPATLAELVGQPDAVAQLAAFAASPYPTALLFSGPTGTGKTCAARALAADLGCDVAQEEFGGLHAIASGEQTAESVRAALRALATRPFCGSGWKVLVVNECDRMTDAAAFVWLDALENLPARAVVVFTTNDPAKLPARLRDRCERCEFTGDALALRGAAQELLRRVWSAELPAVPVPPLAAFRGLVDGGTLSFRRLLQVVTPWVRRGEAPPTAEPTAAVAAAPARTVAPARTIAPAKPATDPARDAALKAQRDEIIARLTGQLVGV